MGRQRLTKGFALSALFVSMASPALELDMSQHSLALVEQGCGYGRGALAIEEAKAEGLNNLRLFLQGENSFSLSTDDMALVDEHFSQSSREMLANGIASGVVRAEFGEPEIYGDDTCITVKLAPTMASPQSGQGDIAWEDELSESVVVIGEGKRDSKAGLSARQAAEQDAFRRAISQVLGVMVKSGFLQQSYSNTSASATSDDFNIEEVVRQSLSLQSQGMISSWNEISSKTNKDGSMAVTLDVTVEKQKLEDKVAQTIKSLGQPAVYVTAHLPVVHDALSDALAEMGFDLTERAGQASIILDVTEKQNVTPVGLQLEMAIVMRDRAGNRYGTWRNNPTFMALPNEAGMLNELARVHLAVEDNQKAIKQLLHRSIEKMAMRGGPVRELIFSSKAAGSQGQLYTLISAINGVSDIKMSQRAGKVVIQLRSMSNAGDLAQFIEPTLRVHQPSYRSKLSVLNEYQVSVL